MMYCCSLQILVCVINAAITITLHMLVQQGLSNRSRPSDCHAISPLQCIEGEGLGAGRKSKARSSNTMLSSYQFAQSRWVCAAKMLWYNAACRQVSFASAERAQSSTCSLVLQTKSVVQSTERRLATLCEHYVP